VTWGFVLGGAVSAEKCRGNMVRDM
jgi:hypothetical protein